MYYISFSKLMTLKLCGQYSQINGWDHTGGINTEHNILVYVISGECSFTVNGKVTTMQENDIILLPKNTYYVPHTDTQCSYRYFHFDANVSTQPPNNTINLMYNEEGEQFLAFPEKFSADDSFNVYFDRILNNLSNSTPESNIRMNTDFINLLVRISDTHNKLSVSQNLKEIDSYISENINTVTLSTISGNFGYSKQHIIRMFKSGFNLSPTEYIITKKLAKSIVYFANGSMTIAEAAYASGFSDPNYFSRAFKKHYSVSPSEYRKRFINGI